MSSRKQRQLLQLSVATLLIFQFLVIFSPSISSTILSSIRYDPRPIVQIRYDLKIVSMDGRQLSTPLFFSEHRNHFGIEDYAAAQFLVDELARALNQKDSARAQLVYSELVEIHFDRLDNYEFEIQKINLARVPIESRRAGTTAEVSVLGSWSSDQLQGVKRGD